MNPEFVYLRMKHVLRLLGIVLLGVLSGPVYGQDKIPLLVSGRKQTTLSGRVQQGVTYVDLQKTARSLGLNVELFARSKQAKLTARGFYAILTAPLKEFIINAKSAQLTDPVQIDGGKMLVPVEFFLLPDVQKAVGKEISFSDGKLQVERFFGLERTENGVTAAENRIVFVPRGQVTWSSQAPNPHTVEVIFPNVTIKRDENFRFKTDFISSVSIRQDRADAKMRVILGKSGSYWTVEETDGKIYFRVGANKLAPIPSVTPVQTTPVAAETKTASAAIETSAREIEEMPAEEEPVSAISAISSASAPTLQASAPAVVMKPGPVAAISSAHKKMRIVVDPGHGGKDPGALRSRVREKDLNLAVGKELYKLLKKGNFEVKITRDNDTFIPLSERSKLSNNFKADLFVSVHTNSSKNRNANGFEVYFRSEKATDKEAAETAALENEAMQYEEVHYNFVDALLQSLAKNEYINESSKLAGYVRNEVYKQPGIGIAVNKNSSVRQANFYVLKGVQSPAILVEMGYISSSKDRGRLTQGGVQKKMAQGIYNGIYNYAKQEGWIK